MKIKTAVGMLLLSGVFTLMTPTALADGYANNYNVANDYDRVYNAQTSHYVYRPEEKTLGAKIREGFKDLWHTPAIKKGALGAGAGLGVAALAEKNLLRGSAIGAGVGAGVGVMDEMRFFSKHPFVRRTSKGALVGVGAAAATGAAALLPAAAVGAGIGAGIHYIKRH